VELNSSLISAFVKGNYDKPIPASLNIALNLSFETKDWLALAAAP
jgi:hypothetical protein